MPAIVAGSIALLIWLWLLLGQGGFWRVRSFLALPRSAELTGKIAVVIPARDEADVVGQCIASLLNQTYKGPVHIFLVDDGSKDGTAETARRAIAQPAKPSALTIIRGAPLPAGWSGKLWAVHQGIQQALELGPQFILLTHADIEHAPESLSTLVAIAESGGYDLASYMVKLHCGTFAERLLIPAFVFFFFKIYPPAWIENP